MVRLSGLFFVLALAAALLVGGCGEDVDTPADAAATAPVIYPPTVGTTTPECDLTAPSIIPAPTGLPRLIYFFRDT